MSEREKTIPNIDYLGRSYDVVTMDPLNLGGTAKNQNVIDIDVQDGHTVHTRDGSYVVPAGVRHSAPFSMSLAGCEFQAPQKCLRLIMV